MDMSAQPALTSEVRKEVRIILGACSPFPLAWHSGFHAYEYTPVSGMTQEHIEAHLDYLHNRFLEFLCAALTFCRFQSERVAP